jgi:hypothetical protein
LCAVSIQDALFQFHVETLQQLPHALVEFVAENFPIGFGADAGDGGHIADASA